MIRIILCLIFASVVLSNNLFAQKAIEKAAEVSCKCIEEKYDKTKPAKNSENIMTECIQEAFLANIDAFTEEYGMEIVSDHDKAYKIGEQLGIEIAKNCPAFIELSMELAKAEEESVKEVTAGKVSGKVVRIENKEFVHIILQDDNGKETDLIWLRYFQNSDQFKGNIESLKGKYIVVDFTETEVYLPKAQDYFKVKEIIGIDL